MYGNSINAYEKAVCYQCGKVFRKIDNEKEIHGGFRHNGVSFRLNFTVEVLQKCIEEKSNKPYWDLYYYHSVNEDLRNPKHKDKLLQIKKQFGL